jgi:hypothetical protein
MDFHSMLFYYSLPPACQASNSEISICPVAILRFVFFFEYLTHLLLTHLEQLSLLASNFKE